VPTLKRQLLQAKYLLLFHFSPERGRVSVLHDLAMQDLYDRSLEEHGHITREAEEEFFALWDKIMFRSWTKFVRRYNAG